MATKHGKSGRGPRTKFNLNTKADAIKLLEKLGACPDGVAMVRKKKARSAKGVWEVMVKHADWVIWFLTELGDRLGVSFVFDRMLPECETRAESDEVTVVLSIWDMVVGIMRLPRPIDKASSNVMDDAKKEAEIEVGRNVCSFIRGGGWELEDIQAIRVALKALARASSSRPSPGIWLKTFGGMTDAPDEDNVLVPEVFHRIFPWEYVKAAAEKAYYEPHQDHRQL